MEKEGRGLCVQCRKKLEEEYWAMLRERGRGGGWLWGVD